MLEFIDTMIETLDHVTEDMKTLRDITKELQHKPDLTKVRTSLLIAELARRVDLIEGEL